MGDAEQRRGTFRVGLTAAAVVRRGDGGTAARAQLRDLSIDGARLLGELELRPGEAVTITLELEDDESALSGDVVRVGELGAGIRFGALRPADESCIARFLNDQERRRGRPRV